MRFEWDDNKAESNFLKHDITFEEAVTVFADPYLLFTEDSKHSEQEEREWAIGETENGSMIVVVFTMRRTDQDNKCEKSDKNRAQEI